MLFCARRPPRRTLPALGGGTVEASERDFAINAIANVMARPLMSDMEGRKVIGPENAIAIIRALEGANVISFNRKD